jgi:radical SAM superfamily enzyme YgiQ (UPF0313 family)
MKVLLVEPTKSPITIAGDDLSIFEPLALEYVGAGVATDHDVRILDMRLGGMLDATLAEFEPDVVGVTGYTVHVKPVRRICRRVKEWNPAVLTVVGGHHATVAAGDFLSPHIDLVVRGEGVEPFRQIVDRLERGKCFRCIPGVEVRDGDRLLSGPPPPAIDLDLAPKPLRSLTAHYRSDYNGDWLRPLASMRTSKGCPFRCNFCAQWKTAHGRYPKRAPYAVLEELASIEEECVFFADDESLVDVERMRDLALKIKDAGIKKRLYLYGRSDTISKHPDLIEAWCEAGLERIFVGFEFFRDDDLEFVGKGTTVDDNARAAGILKDLGLDVHASFIVRPEFDRDDFAAMGDYVRELELDFAGYTVLTPLPGTDLYDAVEEQLLTRDTDFYDFLHTVLPTRLPLDEFCAELYRLYRTGVPLGKQMGLIKRFPVREWPSITIKTNKVFRRLKNMAKDYAPVM